MPTVGEPPIAVRLGRKASSVREWLSGLSPPTISSHAVPLGLRRATLSSKLIPSVSDQATCQTPPIAIRLGRMPLRVAAWLTGLSPSTTGSHSSWPGSHSATWIS